MPISNADIKHYIYMQIRQVMCAIPDGVAVESSVLIIRSSLSPSPASVNAPTEMRYGVPGVSWVKVNLVWLGCRVTTSESLE